MLFELGMTTETVRVRMPSGSDGESIVTSAADLEEFANLSDVTDAQLAEAAMTAVASGTLTPLIKVELKSAIQAKRLAQGKEELEVNMAAPEKTELTEEEVERRLRRRERNKLAAQKCRLKRKGRAEALMVESERLEKVNDELRDLVKKLQQEREHLALMFTSHEPLCLLNINCQKKQEENNNS